MGNIITSFSVPEGSLAAEWLRGIRVEHDKHKDEPTVSLKLRQLIEGEGDWMLQTEALKRQRKTNSKAFKYVIRDCEKCNDEWWRCQE